MTATEDPYRSNNLRASAWVELKATQRAIGRHFDVDPTREAVIKAALLVAMRHEDEFTAAIREGK